jgi:hypothetical protein
MRKIIAVRSMTTHGSEPSPRYISKNNANIARLSLLPILFPDCRIVIPFRNPWDHIKSLRNQHKRFANIHDREPFSLLYMEWLGHFEFGKSLRPINFNKWVEKHSDLDPHNEVFWLNYWVETYEAILTSVNSNMCFFDYDRACANPERSLRLLADALEMSDPNDLLEQTRRFRVPTAYKDSSVNFDIPLHKRIQEAYLAMVARSSQ